MRIIEVTASREHKWGAYNRETAFASAKAEVEKGDDPAKVLRELDQLLARHVMSLDPEHGERPELPPEVMEEIHAATDPGPSKAAPSGLPLFAVRVLGAQKEAPWLAKRGLTWDGRDRVWAGVIDEAALVVLRADVAKDPKLRLEAAPRAASP